MTVCSLVFGFHPDPLEIDAGEITIRSLPNREAAVGDLRDEAGIEKDWIYAPAQRSRDFMTGAVDEKSYSSRVFGLPKTHTITHRQAENEDHLTFHLWSLSFFTGLRLTATEVGFLDATPLKPGKLVDFVLLGDSLFASVELAERFWSANLATPRQAQRFAAAVHALFLAQYPPALQFERFLYLYAALDACFALAKDMHPPSEHVPHSDRAAWLIAVDDDGEHFFDYVSWRSVVEIVGADDDSYGAYLAEISRLVERGLHHSDARVLRKYLWLHRHYLAAIELFEAIPADHPYRAQSPDNCELIASLPRFNALRAAASASVAAEQQQS